MVSIRKSAFLELKLGAPGEWWMTYEYIATGAATRRCASPSGLPASKQHPLSIS
jgi:hypothetical protein